ncbi:MAG: hypothetical protein AB1505_20030 [Candidatus Latescibacterota bacterium]
MPFYRHREATGRADEVIVIEDATMVERDEDGVLRPTFAFVDDNTVRAHPVIIDSLLENAERLWSLEELLQSLGG